MQLINSKSDVKPALRRLVSQLTMDLATAPAGSAQAAVLEKKIKRLRGAVKRLKKRKREI